MKLIRRNVTRLAAPLCYIAVLAETMRLSPHLAHFLEDRFGYGTEAFILLPLIVGAAGLFAFNHRGYRAVGEKLPSRHIGYRTGLFVLTAAGFQAAYLDATGSFPLSLIGIAEAGVVAGVLGFAGGLAIKSMTEGAR
ncbi:hypothetical protein ACFC1T_08740 [Kitasatospora sp. NPDC056076]|uniref:hypothetical protein n=1 Tax=Kitasatospora sp. NPDC056076 TaxID=3345703 RepID=UPI0035DA6FB9